MSIRIFKKYLSHLHELNGKDLGELNLQIVFLF
jgi:hypothetical protein